MTKRYYALENKNYYQYTEDGQFVKPKNKERKILKRRVRRIIKKEVQNDK